MMSCQEYRRIAAIPRAYPEPSASIEGADERNGNVGLQVSDLRVLTQEGAGAGESGMPSSMTFW